MIGRSSYDASTAPSHIPYARASALSCHISMPEHAMISDMPICHAGSVTITGHSVPYRGHNEAPVVVITTDAHELGMVGSSLESFGVLVRGSRIHSGLYRPWHPLPLCFRLHTYFLQFGQHGTGPHPHFYPYSAVPGGCTSRSGAAERGVRGKQTTLTGRGRWPRGTPQSGAGRSACI